MSADDFARDVRGYDAAIAAHREQMTGEPATCQAEPIIGYRVDDDGVWLECAACRWEHNLGFHASMTELEQALEKHRTSTYEYALRTEGGLLTARGPRIGAMASLLREGDELVRRTVGEWEVIDRG